MSSRILIAFDLRQLLAWEGHNVVLRRVEATHVRGKRRPCFPATSTVTVSNLVAPSAVLGDTDRKTSTGRIIELFYRLLRVFDVLPQRGQFLPNVFSGRR
jgi:hypothetical protein